MVLHYSFTTFPLYWVVILVFHFCFVIDVHFGLLVGSVLYVLYFCLVLNHFQVSEVGISTFVLCNGPSGKQA